MKGFIRVAAAALLWAVAAGAVAATNKAVETVDKAIAAMGGEKALKAVRTVVYSAATQHWEPQSSVVTGGEFRLAGISTILVSRDFESRASRVDWDRQKVGPQGRAFKYSEVYSDGVGAVFGIDGTSRTRQSIELGGRHAMSGIRLATFLREQHRASPLLVLDMKANPGALEALPDRAAGGKTLKAVRYDAGRYAFTVMFDPQTGLPERVRSRDTDPIIGDVDYDLVLGDWRGTGGVRFAHALTYELGGKAVGKVEIGRIDVNTHIAFDQFLIPSEVRARRILPAMGHVPYQWVERRGWWGTFRDSDVLTHDPDAPAPTLADIAPGVSQTSGTSHNSLIVEMKDYLIVFDAPIGEEQSRWTIDAAKAKYKKPVKYLMLTHHHWDHANGARTYVAEGATVIVGKGNREHFARMFSAPHTVIPDELARNPRKASIVEVADRHVISDGSRQVGFYHFESAHSTGTLIGMVHDVKLGFVTDIWSPGRDPLPKSATKPQIELVQAVRRHGLDPERFAGGHGSTGNFAELASLIDRTAPKNVFVPARGAHAAAARQ